MSRRPARPRVFALCGVDGVGKTSLFRMLSERLRGPEFAFVGRGPADAERMVERRFPRRFGDWRDWVEGEHSEALVVACALDYGVYYERAIRPLVEPDAGEGPPPRAVLTDRHAICFMAFAHCNPSPNRLAVKLLGEFRPPDVIFYITLPEEVIQTRISAEAGRRVDEFENVNAQRRLGAAYEMLLPHYPSRVVVIDNSGTLEETCERLSAEVFSYLDEEQAHAAEN